MKKLKHLFTALLLLCCVGTATAHDFEVGGIYYNISSFTNKTVEVTYRDDYSSSYDDEYTGSVVIPESVTYNGSAYSVTSIGNWAFGRCTGLTSITIPNSVTNIGDNAFNGCSGLKTVINFSNLTFSKRSEDYGCVAYYADKVYNAPNGFIDGDFIWYENEDGMTLAGYLGNATGLSLPADYNGKSVTSIGDDAFSGCTSLTSITIPNSVTSIGEGAFNGCTGLTSIEIPNSVTSIGNDAFYKCKGITSITIPNSVTSIGNSAFYGCTGLTSIEIPNSVTSIGESAFYGCTGLKTVINFSNLTFSKGYISYGYVAYYADNVYNVPNGFIDGDFIWYENEDGMTLAGYLGNATELALPADYNGKSVTSIGNDAFYGCTGLTSIVIGNSVTTIGDWAFGRCTELTSITIPNSVTSIGWSAFYGCTGLTSITIPNSVTSIRYRAFSGCSGLTSIEIPNSVTSIGDGAFEGCKGLTSITIPNSVTSIGSDAFRGCTGLTSITIPNSVTSIGGNAFYNCTGLKTVYNFSNLTFSKGSSNNGYVAYYADNVYNVPNGSIEGDFIFGKPNGVNTLLYYLGNTANLILPTDYKGKNYAIGADVFKDNTVITSVTIPNCVTGIGASAFYGCTGLTSITIPNSVTSIGRDAFCRCNNLRSIELSSSLTAIEQGVFSRTGLTEITILEGVTSLGIWAFDNCPALVKVNLPKTLTSIGNFAFESCTTLANIIIPDNVTSIGNQAFYDCSGLKTVYNFSNLTFSKGSSSNGYVAYYATKVYNVPNGFIDGDFIWYENEDGMTLAGYLGNATGLALPADYKGKSVTSIGSDAFNGCTGLTSIEIPNSVTSIGNTAFYNCTGLKTVYNFSNLTFSKGSSSNGYVAYYATKVINAPNAVIDGDFIWCNLNGVNTLACYLGEVAELTLPADYNGENYVIGNDAFSGCTGLTSITIPNSVTSIGSDAFRGCTGLTSITIPNSVTSIGNRAFYDCTGLKTVINFSNLTFSKGSSYNGYVAYYATKVINAPNAVIDGDFIWCNLNGANTLACYLGEVAELTLQADYNGEKYVIGNDAFNGCTGLASVVIPSSVTNIGEDAFTGCTGLKTVYNFSNLTFSKGSSNNGYVAYYADKVYNAPNGSIEGDFIFGKPNDVNTLLYYLGNTANLILPTDYKGKNYAIGADVFKDNTVITSVTIPNSVTSIGDYAFYGCYGLTSITIPNSVTSIGNWAFCNCYGLTSVEFNAEYCTTMGSSGYPVFSNCTALSTITIGENVKNIPAYAFYECTGLTSITIPNSVTSIGNDAFYNCTGLTSIEFNAENCTTMGSFGYPVFSNCTALSTITIGENVKNIPAYAFYECTGLEKVCINNLVAWCGIDFGSADANPLYYAKNLYLNGELLTELSIPSEIEEVKDYAFYNCANVTKVEVLDKVKVIGNSAFYGCCDLETIYISNTIESIDDYAFAECNNLLEIKIGSKKAITASENIFSSDAYNNACLYVPTGRKFAYEKTAPWSNFHIVEMDFTGIDEVLDEVKGENGKVKTIYDLNGRAVENPSNGIYILNGKKVLVK